HDLPDFVYFNHSIHVAKGVGCETCHGRVDQMSLMSQQSNLQMRWCLDCHRAPEKYVRPREFVTTMGYEPSEPQETLGPKLVKEYHIQKLETCWTCHR
ncbi:MAG TPA: cytochrome c3 family protein, partial [Bryobacteraceae bacterium]|nr:cytochrome c3 family protein [Bryobacteraceae bacterium]